MKRSHWVLAAVLAVFVARGAAAEERRIMTPVVTPQQQAGRVYAGAGLIATFPRVESQWQPARRELMLVREGRKVILRAGDAVARVNGRPVHLALAPYLRQDQLMVPIRLIAESLGVPVKYEEATATLLLGPDADEVLWAFPLPTRRTGLVIHSPASGTEWVKEIRVHGQANIPDAEAVVQLQTSDGKVLMESKLPRGRGVFGEFQVIFSKAEGGGGKEEVRVVAFAPDPKDHNPRHQINLPLTLHLSGGK